MTPLRKLAAQILIGIVLAVVLVYIGDSISVRVRMMHATPNNPYETVTALRILAIADKGNKTEYMVDQVQPQQTAECVHALFPHNGDLPCWYLKRKFAQPIPMTILPGALQITAAVLSCLTEPKEDLEDVAHSWRRATIGSNRIARRAGM